MPLMERLCRLAPAWLPIFLFILLWHFAEGASAEAADYRRSLPDAAPAAVTLLENQAYEPALQKAIDNARKEIACSFFSFKIRKNKHSLPDVILARLGEAARRGVRVTVLLDQGRDPDDSTSRENREAMTQLQKKGVQVFLDSPQRTTHTKMAVIDRRYTFIGSHNLTQSALRYNNEMSVLIESPQIAAEALEYINFILPGRGY